MVFVLAFGGQLGVTFLAYLALLLFVPPASSSPLTAWVLVAVSGLMLPTALLLSALFVRAGGKEGAMAATIALGVLLAAPAWFALFAWLVGSSARFLLLLLGLLALYYALGLLLAGRYAGVAVAPPEP